MFKNTMVWLSGGDGDSVALRTAYCFAKRFGGHINGVHVRLDPLAIARAEGGYDAFGVSTWTEETYAAVNAGIAETAKRAQDRFEHFCAKTPVSVVPKPPCSSVSASYEEIEGSFAATLVTQARRYDALVSARTGELDVLGTLLVGVGRPLLIGASENVQSIGDNIAIAWKDTAEAARAVGAAMPLLARARAVTILTANDSKDAQTASAEKLAATLQWNDIPATVSHVSSAVGLPEAVVETAHAIRADLLVMGAYGHSRARAFVFGGFTRTLLRECSIPLFLMH